MADKPIREQWLVDPTKEIQEMWAKVELQQKVSLLQRTKQDIEDLEKGQILNLKAKAKMLELEIKRLESELMKIRSIETTPQGGK